MNDPRLENLAKILVDYSIAVKPGDWVVVRGSSLAFPLLEAVVRNIYQSGGHPTTLIENDALEEIHLRYASDAQLEWISPFETLAFQKMDALITVRAPGNTRLLSGIDPQKTRLQTLARKDLHQTYMDRSAEGSLRWVSTQYPCPAYAQDADMSLSDYEDFVYAATFADQPDPVACWHNVHAEQQRLVEWLKGKDRVSVRGPNCDLSLSIAGRKFSNSDGHRNMPSGEIFTGPVEDSVDGWIRFTYPAIYRGREVEGVELKFKAGKVVNARASKNEAYLLALLDSDPGARYLGEFAIGTNYGIQRFTRSILYDEKIGGSIHLAVGAGYPETGSLNKSAIHWDFICDMRDGSEILVDGELFYRNGKFML
ncbi:MAG TPA: aminopeptidase [Anaerolineales bacterium]|nr:aminopeptidase [Anaerolineales bacterium]